jgi:hypothetical protein
MAKASRLNCLRVTRSAIALALLVLASRSGALADSGNSDWWDKCPGPACPSRDVDRTGSAYEKEFGPSGESSGAASGSNPREGASTADPTSRPERNNSAKEKGF